MNKFRTLTPDQLEDNVFRLISKDWMLITAQRKDGTANTMTASWGSLGVNRGMPVATVYIRHSRYTLPFVDEAEGFSLCVFGEEYRPQLAYCGKVSGRDEDKIAKCGFTLAREDGIPYFEEARLVFLCRKVYAQDMPADCFVDKGILDQWYKEGDHHRMVLGEITKVLAR